MYYTAVQYYWQHNWFCLEHGSFVQFITLRSSCVRVEAESKLHNTLSDAKYRAK